MPVMPEQPCLWVEQVLVVRGNGCLEASSEYTRTLNFVTATFEHHMNMMAELEALEELIKPSLHWATVFDSFYRINSEPSTSVSY